MFPRNVGMWAMVGKLDDTFAAIVAADTPQDRWAVLTRGLADVGLDQVNYAFLDFATYSRMDARGDPAMTTMRGDWISHYVERQYDMDDDIVAHVRAGRSDPKFFRLSRPDHFRQRTIAEEAREAGMQAGLLTPLPGPWGDLLPAAGLVMGSSLGEDEAARIAKDHAPDLIALAYLVHTSMSGELLRRRAGAAPLSPRERDCLQMTARGLRVSQIADRLMIADVTVHLHLRRARVKLAARTLPEAVSKAMLYRQISPG